MKELFWNMLTAGLSGTVLILAVILARFALCRAPKRYACLLWLLVGLRLLVPFTIESHLSLQPSQSAVTHLHAELSTDQKTPIPTLPPSTGNAVTSPNGIPSAPVTEGVTESLPTNTHSTVRIADKPDYAAIASWVWFIGTCSMASYALISYCVLKYKLRCAVPLHPGVYEDSSVRSPFLLGYLKPRIYLPRNVAKEYYRHIVAHERCHIRRGDNWVKLIGYICLAVHWYNPLVWLAYSLLCKDMEMACDEAVVRSMDTTQRKAYSAALLSCAAKRQNFSDCPVAFGEVSVKQRILKVLQYKKPAFWLTIAAVVALGVIAVCFLTSPAADNGPEEINPVEKCRQAIVKLQNAESYYLTQTDFSYYFETVLGNVYDRSYHARSGENWYHQFTSSNWCTEYLIYDDRQFAKTTTDIIPQEDVIYPDWTETDLSKELPLQDFCWLLSFDWDAQPITLKEASEDGNTITLLVERSEPEVISESLLFVFGDANDNTLTITRSMHATYGNICVSYTIDFADASDTAAMLESKYNNILNGTDETPTLSGTVSATMLTQPSAVAYEEYHTFFYSQFGSGDKVIFADVTHDGEAEMLVMHPYLNGELCYGFVFTIDASVVKLLYINSGGMDHANGFYGWYLKPAENGYNLAEETFGMNNGIGTLSFEEYHLRPDGKRISVDRIYVSSEGSEDGVTEEAMDHYVQQLNERIAAFYLIHNTATESNGSYMYLDDSLLKLFN